ncbi:MAG: Glycosyl transferase family 2 [Candidatus Daviesbacteria bacterium GW2011_GWA2_38_24]|uniref:Glycosyl transferase family 2 n=1 Tax=Candidatus Daviesbacteria bacterium GW2011_GWA2_38_24 TaxID=1618422 RepID=A0A0G0JHV1_9BACT|nr:MAG: Glycosyl transferase family 2 [Candidatus Daviesbacteria bacterium GW2011_GWA2_38_24]KKQ79168.1 MAG: Glycosyl transferase family 2 [Candidatus Daviesbacteria bacterium GW2011_GWA1_38_7]
MISAIVLTKNEEKMIQTCLESIKWVDEIIVVDNGSTDKTLEEVQKYTEKIYQSDKPSFAERRNLGLSKAKGNFILCVDADERVTHDLKTEILEKVNSSFEEVAWDTPRRNIILGEEKRYKPFWPDYVTRLFKREFLKGWVGDVHEYPEFDGKHGKLKNALLHLTHRDIDSMVLKSLSWANIDAKLRVDANHPQMTGWRFLRILFTELWNQGIKRRGFFNGTVGVIDALLQVFSMYISYVKLWQLQRKETLEETYQKIDQQLLKSNFRY